MAEFFRNLVNGYRIWSCTNHVLTNIQNLSSTQGSHLALMGALFRAKMLEVPVPGGSFSVGDVIQHPTAYRKELCVAAFRVLEEIRQTSRDNVNSYESFGVSPNPAILEHTELCDLTLSLLMSTIGVGCKPSTLEAVKYSWEHVVTYAPTVEDIELAMKMPEYIVNDIIEQPLETTEWLELARKSPEFLKPQP